MCESGRSIQTSYAYRDADGVTSVNSAASTVTYYTYDTENNLLSIKDANGNTTSFANDGYDSFVRFLRLTENLFERMDAKRTFVQ